MKPHLHIIIVVCLLCAAPMSRAEETVKVASIFGKTGAGAVSNLSITEGIRFAVQELNQKGGLLGRRIELIEFDNQSSAIHSRRAAEKAVKAGVVAVFGANWSAHSFAMAPVLQAARIPMISPISTSPDITLVGNYIFRTCFVDTFQGSVMARFAVQDLEARTAAILVNANSRYSEGLAGFFHRHFVSQGGKIVYEAGYLRDTDDFSRQIKLLVSLKPDVLFVPGYSVDSALIIRQARENGLSCPILGGDGWAYAMRDVAGTALNGCYHSEHWHEDLDSRSRQFAENYRGKSGSPHVSEGSALAYDTVFLFADAVRRAGSPDPERIRDALAVTRDFKGITGNITFDDHGDPIKPAVIVKFDQGAWICVKTVMP